MFKNVSKTYYVVMVNVYWDADKGSLYRFLRTKDSKFNQTEEEFAKGWRVFHKETFKPEWAKEEIYWNMDEVV